MKIEYITCDVCGYRMSLNKIFPETRYGVGARFTFKRFFKRSQQLDICNKCLQKLHIVTEDVYTREKVLKDTNYSKYEDTDLCSAYLEGVEDTLKLLNDYKIESAK